ncbi:phenylacetate--CoA ligase family protein [Janthinobacterium fluminis]|uniref:Phenylacetate--CoA ligase family protein n=1 Tax=Janthinobacterium fluminis TaxID=2987524 RepID=A0ABT5JY01_9BURK|nr:phenylacetate--CoA ligase family protein [Janthinobacterium fluminis]MDC8757612.1 phenylacetate--CoA ligase family protein [Janthinobacterium fluminis]
MRELVRGFWARYCLYPRLARNERSPEALASYIAQRRRSLGLAPAGHGAAPRRISDTAGLISKIDLKTRPAQFLRPRRLGSLIRGTIKTSGSTGQPLTVIQDLACVLREEAFVYRQLRWIGYRHGERRASLRGDMACAAAPRDGRYWCRDWVGNMLLMSSYHLSAQTVGAYIEALERFNPTVIHAYPSSIATLANWLKANGRRYQGTALRGIMTSSETLLPEVRACVDATFGVATFDWYGQAERVVAIGTCEQGNYHLLTDYSDVELLDTEGQIELVGTSLNNRATILQRYRTGDRVTLAAQGCACGRVFPVIESVHGRNERVIVLPDGRQVGPLGHVFKDAAQVLEGQIIYRGNARFLLRVVPMTTLSPDVAAQLVANLLYRVPDVEVEVEVVGAIPRGPNGKFEFLSVVEEPQAR